MHVYRSTGNLKWGYKLCFILIQVSISWETKLHVNERDIILTEHVILLQARLDILRIHSRKMNLTRGINLRKIAEVMPGASGAEVKVERGCTLLRVCH